MVAYCFVPQGLDADEDANPVSDLFDTQLLQDCLIALDEVAPRDIVGYVMSASERPRREALGTEEALLQDLPLKTCSY